MWGAVSCLRKQHDGRDRASNHRGKSLKNMCMNVIVHQLSEDGILNKAMQDMPFLDDYYVCFGRSAG